MSDLTNALIAAKLIGAQGGGSGGLPPIISDVTVILNTQSLPFEDAGGETYEHVDETITTPLVEGLTYVVEWDSTEYECVSFDFNGFVAIGNKVIAGGADTGEPFFITIDPGFGLVIDTLSSAASHSVGLRTSGTQTPPDGYVLMVVDGEWKAVPSGGGTYYIMEVEPAGDDLADLNFYRPNDEVRISVMGVTASVETDTETGGQKITFGEISVNPEADPPITDVDIAAMELKIASWSYASYSSDFWYSLITGEISAEFYVYPYIL